MKKRIILGSILAVFLLLLMPVVPALKYNTIVKENKSFLFEKLQSYHGGELRQKLNGGLGLLELFIAFLMLLYVELGIIFNRSFTLILLLATILYNIGVRLGLIEPTPIDYL
jgi:hypothetical protein